MAERLHHRGPDGRGVFVDGPCGLAHARLAILDPARGDRSRMGVYLGSGEGAEDFPALVNSIAVATGPDGRADPLKFTTAIGQVLDREREAEVEMHTTCGHLAHIFALDGPNFACQTACAASSQAIGEAAELIRAGDADVIAAGGSHSMLHPLGITGFNRLTALSQRNDSPRTASRPFDLTRDGFVIGEGAGMDGGVRGGGGMGLGRHDGSREPKV